MKRAFYDSAPGFFAYFPLGIVFGCLFVSMGFPWYLAIVMSTIVYGGSVQFLCLSLLSSGGSLFEIACGGVLLSLRNFFYGFAFLDRKSSSLLSRFYMMFGLVDATYSILVADKEKDGNYAFTVNWLIHLYWVLGTLIGALVNIPSLPHLDFVLPALFTCLVIDHWQPRPALIAIISAGCAYVIFPSQFVLIGILISIVLLVTSSGQTRRATT